MTDPAAPELPDNWGRWGAEDERGTLNLITDEVRARAAAEARTGRWASPAQPIEPDPMISSPFAPTTVDVSPVQQMMSYTGVGVAADLMPVTNHARHQPGRGAPDASPRGRPHRRRPG